MIRFAIKAGIAASAVYYLNREGIWKESNESLKAYNKLNTTLEPYVKEIRKQIPFELPEVPENARTSQTAKIYWNKAVLNTFQFLKGFPDLASTWIKDGIDVIMDNPEVQKVLDLDSSASSKVGDTASAAK